MDVTAAVFITILALAALAWLLIGRSPPNERDVEHPVDAGAKQQTPPFDPDRGLHR